MLLPQDAKPESNICLRSQHNNYHLLHRLKLPIKNFQDQKPCVESFEETLPDQENTYERELVWLVRREIDLIVSQCHPQKRRRARTTGRSSWAASSAASCSSPCSSAFSSASSARRTTVSCRPRARSTSVSDATTIHRSGGRPGPPSQGHLGEGAPGGDPGGGGGEGSRATPAAKDGKAVPSSRVKIKGAGFL